MVRRAAQRPRAASWAALVALALLWRPPTAAGHPEPHPKTLFPLGRVRVLLAAGASLTPNASALTADGQAIAVAVAGVDDPGAHDLVALYAPPGADPTRTVPLAWQPLAASSPGYTASGAGRVVFKVINHRADFVFRLLRNGSTLPGQPQPVIVAAESRVVRNTITARPAQGHLALDARGRLVVQWVSGSRGPQGVQWGPAPGALRRAVPSSPVTYSAAQMCGAPANSTGWLDPGWQHRATISEMPPPGSRLWYRFGSDADGWSAVYSAVAPAAPGAPVKFLTFNDVGMTSPILFNSQCPPYCPGGFNWSPDYATNSSKLVPHLAKEDADLALLLGDLAYSQGYASDWDVFGTQFEPAFTRWPLMVATGNHEADWPGRDAFQGLSHDSGGECNVPFTFRYYAPRAAPLDATRSWYSFNTGNVHFLILDSERPTQHGSPQHSFAAADLAAVNRSVTPWIVVGLHRMMAAPSTDTRPVVGDNPVMARLQADFEELFIGAGVTLVLCGHEHAYARTCAMRKGRCDPDGLVHVLTGNAGAGFTHGFPLAPGGGYAFEPWVEYGVQDKNGYVRVSTTAGGEMRVEAVGTDDGAVFDAVTLRLKQRAGKNGISGGGSGSGGSGGGGSSSSGQRDAKPASTRLGWGVLFSPLTALTRSWF